MSKGDLNIVDQAVPQMRVMASYMYIYIYIYIVCVCVCVCV
jgi:hypothetical protein